MWGRVVEGGQRRHKTHLLLLLALRLFSTPQLSAISQRRVCQKFFSGFGERGVLFPRANLSFPFRSSLTPSEECNVVGLLCSRPGCPRPKVTLDVLSNEPKALIMLQASLQASTG